LQDHGNTEGQAHFLAALPRRPQSLDQKGGEPISDKRSRKRRGKEISFTCRADA